MIDWSRVETVFLDMDGTLLDLHFDNHFWLDHLPRRYGEHYNLSPQAARDRILPMIMAQRGSLNWYCTDYWSERLKLDITALKAEVGDRIGYRPHVREFLALLHARGLRSVIVTNCHPDPLHLKLERTRLETLVNGIVSSHDLGAAKEAADFWSRLARVEPFRAPATLLIDDSFPVLASACNAGIGQCLAVTAPDSRQPPGADHPTLPSIRHFDELIPGLSARL